MCDHEYKYWERLEESCPHDKYGKVKWEGKTYCIFHAPMEAKKAVDFWKAFDELIRDFKREKAKEWDFEGFIFPDIENRFKEYGFPEGVNVNFREAQFEGEADFSDVQFGGEADFSGAQYEGEADFRWAQFEGGVNFFDAQFKGDADFWRAQFKGGADFREVKFEGDADFIGAQFSGEAYFVGAQFSGEAYFSDVQFSGKANFWDAQFGGETNFYKAQFEGGANFFDAQFKGEANFPEAQFKGWAGFSGAQFKGEAGFIEAQFDGEPDFKWTQFTETVSFKSAIFLPGKNEEDSRADFSRTLFVKEVNFIDIKSQIPLNFSYAQFQGVVGFSQAIFGKKVTFRSTDFHSQVDFQSASISELDFTGATFRVQPYLGDLGASTREVKIENLVGDVLIEFSRGYKEVRKIDEEREQEEYRPFKLDITGGEIDGVFSVFAPIDGITLNNVTFRATVNINPPEDRGDNLFRARRVNFLGDVSMGDVCIEKMNDCAISGNFRIAESDLSRAKFRGIDLSRIDFVNVEWTEILRRKWCIFCRWFRKTEGLYDEIELGNKKTKKDKHNKEMYYAPNLKKILKKEKKEEEIKNTKNDIKRLEEMYRAVASAYEGRRRYGRAGHFKAGEFEVRKCHANILERVILAIYRWISFYGEEVIKPLILLVLVLPLTTALIYLFFHNEIFSSGYNYRLLYDMWNYDCDRGVLWSIIKDWFNTIPLGYKFLSPTITTISDKVASWVNLIGVFERMLAALFTSLFIFALRRKARR